MLPLNYSAGSQENRGCGVFFLCMLACHVEWHMRERLKRMLLDDDDPPAAA
jgi:hypothetical protein